MPSDIYPALRTVSSMARGLVVEPYRRKKDRTSPIEAPQNGMVAHLDVRLSYHNEDGSKVCNRAVAFQFLFAPFHHVFILDAEENWWLSIDDRVDLTQYRCISAHNSCWADGYESEVNRKITDLIGEMVKEINDPNVDWRDINVHVMTSFAPVKVQYERDRARQDRALHYSPLRITHLTYGY